eukprot:TRINITY_DN3469_c0_g1_i1.p1 TRINITY_DN3469_c0_g1~~TRINITY_DN3469_c0_g1_i1.p1  ORF type:complete len:726 (-),score=197.77 TRINITY_DN3469_c0_g1_i1:7-2031(-)
MATERTFVETLQIVVDKFLHPLRDPDLRPVPISGKKNWKEILDREQVKSVFSSIEIILNYNLTLFADLQRRHDEWSVHSCVADVFVELCTFLKVYTDYVANFHHAVDTLHSLKASNAHFKRFIADTFEHLEMQVSLGHIHSLPGRELDSFLITPVQRIPRYLMLLKDLRKYTAPEHPDMENLDTACSMLDGVAHYVNKKTAEGENVRQVTQIQSTITGKFESLVNPNRRFLKQGDLLVVDDRNVAKRSKRHFFLFNDCLVVCKSTDRKGNFPYVDRCDLRKAAVTNHADSIAVKHSFELISSRYAVWLATTSAEEKEDWLSAIQTALKLIGEQKEQYDQATNKVAKQKAEQTKAMLAQQYATLRIDGKIHTKQSIRKGVEDEKEEREQTGLRSFRRLRNQGFSNMNASERIEATEKAQDNLETLLAVEKIHDGATQRRSAEKAADAKQKLEEKFHSFNVGQLRSKGGYREAHQRRASSAEILNDLSAGRDEGSSSPLPSRVCNPTPPSSSFSSPSSSSAPATAGPSPTLDSLPNPNVEEARSKSTPASPRRKSSKPDKKKKSKASLSLTTDEFESLKGAKSSSPRRRKKSSSKKEDSAGGGGGGGGGGGVDISPLSLDSTHPSGSGASGSGGSGGDPPISPKVKSEDAKSYLSDYYANLAANPTGARRKFRTLK